MKSLISWLLVLFMAMFWVFRVIVAVSAQFGREFGGFIVFNNTTEMVLLFVDLFCFILIVKRKLIGGIIFLAGYGWYFGSYIINNLIPALSSEDGVDMVIFQNSIIGILGIIIALCIVINIAFEKVKLRHFTDKKTDWYFDDDKYDRKLDDRADKNQYRTL